MRKMQVSVYHEHQSLLKSVTSLRQERNSIITENKKPGHHNFSDVAAKMKIVKEQLAESEVGRG